MPRGDADIPQAIAGRIDYLHQMLGLQNDEALCCKEHPVCKALRFPPQGWQRLKKIVNMNGTESALFINALGKPQLFSLPALSATDFVFQVIIISAGMLQRWKTSRLSQSTLERVRTTTLAKRHTTLTMTSRPTSTSTLQ